MRLFTFRQERKIPFDPYVEVRYNYILESIEGESLPIAPEVGDVISWKIIENIISNGNAVLITK